VTLGQAVSLPCSAEWEGRDCYGCAAQMVEVIEHPGTMPVAVGKWRAQRCNTVDVVMCNFVML
jgi:hypothetical protein